MSMDIVTWEKVGFLYPKCFAAHGGEVYRMVANIVTPEGVAPMYLKRDSTTFKPVTFGPASDIKPILRKLENITLDQQKDLAMTLGWDIGYWEDFFYSDMTLTGSVCEEHPLTFMDRYVGYPKAMLWLVEHHFCLWPELFDSGEVLDYSSFPELND